MYISAHLPAGHADHAVIEALPYAAWWRSPSRMTGFIQLRFQFVHHQQVWCVHTATSCIEIHGIAQQCCLLPWIVLLSNVRKTDGLVNLAQPPS